MKTPAELRAMLEDAERATPGPWYEDTPNHADAPTAMVVRSLVKRPVFATDIVAHPTAPGDAPHLANCDPATIKWLIERALRCRELEIDQGPSFCHEETCKEVPIVKAKYGKGMWMCFCSKHFAEGWEIARGMVESCEIIRKRRKEPS